MIFDIQFGDELENLGSEDDTANFNESNFNEQFEANFDEVLVAAEIMEAAPSTGVPLAAVIITFSVFMTSLVAIYAWLLKKQYKKAGLFKETKKSHLLEKRDDYNDKFSFLEQ